VRVISIQHRLAGLTSHHFNEAHGFRQELARRGDEMVLLVNTQAEARIVDELCARPVLDDPTFRLEWTFEERSRRFVGMLHEHVDRLVKAGDRVLLTVSTQLEAHALTRWLQELPRRKKPWIVVLFVSDRWNRSGRDEYERQAGEFRKLAAAVASLDAGDARRMIFCALTELLAEELSGLLGTHVDVAPIPLAYGDRAPAGVSNRGSARPRVAILGGTRREKGSHLIPEIIRACRSQVDVELIVQLTNNTLTAEEVATLAAIAGEPHVSVIREAMALPDYHAALDGADVLLFPYEVIPYRKRTSGVFAEAVAYGKPVVATAGTWMAAQIERGRAAGTIFGDLDPDSIARAIARTVAELEPLRRSAQALSAAWRREACLAAFVDFMERQIARRSEDLEPRRGLLRRIFSLTARR